jgi:hypothetical protein
VESDRGPAQAVHVAVQRDFSSTERNAALIELMFTISNGGLLMKYRIAPLFCRPWTLNGMSPRLIESHYEHNYGAALNRLNSVTSELEALDIKNT